MFDKMSKRSYQNTIPTLPEELYDPITNWMIDLPPLSEKPRAIDPRQRGHSKHQQQYQPEQHQRQPNAKYSQPLLKRINKSLIDDGLPKGRDFPEKPQRLEEQFGREQFPLNDNPLFVKSLDYFLRPEYNKWCLSEQSIIQNKTTGEKISVPSSVLPVIPDFSLVRSLNLWRLRNRDVSQRKYEIENKECHSRIKVPFEMITAFPPQDESVETISSDQLLMENHEFRRQLWNSESSISELQMKLDRLTISAHEEKERYRKQNILSSQMLIIRDNQRKELIKKAETLIEANKQMASELKRLRQEIKELKKHSTI